MYKFVKGENMVKKEIVKRINDLNLDKNKYWVVTGSAMVLYGLKEETNDIDLGCTRDLADMLEKRYGAELLDDGTRKITIGVDIELFEDWLFDKVNYILDIPVISLKGLVQMKRMLGREKDLKDIEIINRYMTALK